jgi:hypothetical protein
MNEKYYTYLWLREDGTPYYVGKGSGNRAFVRRSHRFPPPPRDRILIQEFPDELSTFAAEVFLIEFYGREDLGKGRLLNLTDGGENPPKSKPGKIVSQQRREKSSAALKAIGHHPPSRKGIPHTEETKEKIRAFQKQYKKSAEHIRKVADAQRGKRRTQNVR